MDCFGYKWAHLKVITHLKVMVENILKYIVICFVDTRVLDLTSARFFALFDKYLKTVWIMFWNSGENQIYPHSCDSCRN